MTLPPWAAAIVVLLAAGPVTVVIAAGTLVAFFCEFGRLLWLVGRRLVRGPVLA